MSLTKRLNIKVKISELLKLNGANGETRVYRTIEGEQYFGNYPIVKWEEFKEDLLSNGLKRPISLWVEDGAIVIAEGNHRIQAYEQLQMDSIETEISFFYGAENKVDYKTLLGLKD